MTPRFFIGMAAVLAVASISCQPPPSSGSGEAAGAGREPGRIEARLEIWPGTPRDLTQDEAAGGHVLRKHAGRSDDELREPPDNERKISGASTLTGPSTPPP